MTKLKYMFLMMLTMVFGLTLAACSDDDDNAPRFKVQNPELAFEGIGGTQILSVNSDAQPTATVIDGADWCSVSYQDYAEGTYNFMVSVAPSTEEEETTATIRVVSGYSRKDVVVTRAKKQVVVPNVGMEHNAKELAALMKAGINIGNTMECPDGEGAWSGAKVTEAYIQGLKTAGFNAVRIPCAWASHFSDANNYIISSEWLDRVHQVVRWCVANDMYVVLNAHWDGGWLEDHIFDASKEADILKEQKAIWQQVATKMNEFDEHVLFAACNEPGMNETSSGTKSWNAEAVARVVKFEQAMIDVVRATGGNNASRTIIVQGLGTSIESTDKYMTTLPTDIIDGRMMVEVHFYEPYQFALMSEDAGWGKMYYYWGTPNKVEGSDRNTPDNMAEAWVDAQMGKMKAKYTSQGIPVIIGEYSAMLRNVENQEKHEASVAYYGEYVTRVAKNNGCVPFYWETGSVFNRNDGSVKKQNIVDALIKGANEGTYPW